MLKVENITKRFGGIVALKNVDLEISQGEIVGLIGPNGSGKTTLINVISGVYKPEDGRILFKGHDITRKSPEDICRLGVGRTFQIAQSFPTLTVREHVKAGYIFGKVGRKNSSGEVDRRVDEIIEYVGLSGKRNTPAKDLTIVELKRLELARALATRPALLLLDEIFTGLNVAQINEAISLVRRIRESGMTIMLIEHNMRIVMNLCERVVVLHFGEKIAEGRPEEITRMEAVVRAYLGEKYS
ncbi:MAG: ABC transporter ATP-binding protein [Aigarchaeota archaeon]|nr:ABC transporter ATP-binding protein [Candidatus Pelearchaeum maunauluense]